MTNTDFPLQLNRLPIRNCSSPTPVTTETWRKEFRAYISQSSLNFHCVVIINSNRYDVTEHVKVSQLFQEVIYRLQNEMIFTTALTKSPPPVPILSQMNPIHALVPYLRKVHFNTMFPLFLRLPSCLFPSCSRTKIVIYVDFSHACYMPCPYNPWFYHINDIWCTVQIMKLSIT
jgi:hypothetical protein